MDDGQGLAEYALILALIVALSGQAGGLSSTFDASGISIAARIIQMPTTHSL